MVVGVRQTGPVQMRAALTKYRHEFRELAAEMLASRGHRFPGASADGIAAAQDDGMFNGGSQFAHVPRPRISIDRRKRIG